MCCVLIPGTGGRWWQSRERRSRTKKSVSSLDQLQSILQQVCNKSEGMCHLPPYQPSQILLRSRGDISDKEFIIKRQGDKIRTLGRYNV